MGIVVDDRSIGEPIACNENTLVPVSSQRDGEGGGNLIALPFDGAGHPAEPPSGVKKAYIFSIWKAFTQEAPPGHGRRRNMRKQCWRTTN